MPTLPTFNKKILQNCVDVTPESLRLLFPGRKLMLSGFKYLNEVDFTILARSAATLLKNRYENLHVRYIAFCNPVPRIGYGENERSYRGVDDPLFGATRPSFEFTGTTIVANQKKYDCIAPVMNIDFSLEDLLSNENGYIQISLYIIFEADNKCLLYDLSENKTYIEGDVSVPTLKQTAPASDKASEPQAAPSEKLAETIAPKPTPKPAETAKPATPTAPKTTITPAATAKTAAPTAPKTTPKPAETAKPATPTAPKTTPKPAETAKPATPTAPKTTIKSVASTHSKPPVAVSTLPSSSKKTYKYSSLQLYGSAQILRTLFALLLIFCLISTALEITFFSTYYIESEGISNVIGAFVVAVVATALLEGLTALVYIGSYKDVKKRFPVFYSVKDRKVVSPYDKRIVYCRIPVRVRCFYIYIALHFVTRFFYMFFSENLFDLLCNLFF